MPGSGLGSILIRFLPKFIKPAISVGQNILAPLGLSAAMSGKKIHGTETTVIFSNEEITGMVKIVKALEDSDVLMKGVNNAYVINLDEYKNGHTLGCSFYEKLSDLL